MLSDTLEYVQVVISQPSQGRFELTVLAFNVPVGPQDFALVVTGDFVVLPSCLSSYELTVKTPSPSPPVSSATLQPTVNPSGAAAVEHGVMAAES